MPISVACGDCGKKYGVRDELAGKKFRCKECQAVVAVPSADEPDEDLFAGADLRKAGKASPRYDDEDDEAEDYDDAPPRRKKVARAKRPRRRPRGDGMPVSAILAVCCQCVLLGLNSLSLFVKLTNPAPVMTPNETGKISGILLRVAIAGVVLVGLLKRSQNSRLWSRRLSGLGIVFGVIILAIFAALYPSIPTPEAKFEALAVIGVMVLQIGLWTTLVVSLSTDSADEWYNE